MRSVALILSVALSVIVPLTSHAQSQRSKQPTTMDIRSFMNAGEFKGAGLDKLSPQEFEALNQWLSMLAVQIYQTAQGGGGDCSNAIKSQIEGTFEGLSGETVFKLTNGQIWQQSSYAYMYHYAYRPEVTIVPSGGGCKMKVEGVSDSISVQRLWAM